MQGTLAQKESNCLQCDTYHRYNLRTGTERLQFVQQCPEEFGLYIRDAASESVQSASDLVEVASAFLAGTLEERVQERTRQLADSLCRERMLASSNSALLSAIPDLLFQLDAAGVFTSCHAGTDAKLALPPEMFLGKHISDVLPEHVAQATLDAMRTVRATGEDQVFEYSLTVPTDEVRDYEARLASMGSNEFLAVVRDVTEQRRAREATARMALVANAAPSAIIVHGFDGHIFFANKRASEMYGYDEDAFLRLNMSHLIAPTSLTRVGAITEALAARGEAYFETDHFRADGTGLPLGVHARVVTWAGQQAVLSVATDLTDRNRAEEETRLMALMADTAPCSIMAHDFDGCFLYANRQALEMHGYRRDEFLALNLRDVIAPVSLNLVDARLQDIRARGGAQFEAEHIRKDRTILPLDVSVTVVNWAGQPAVLSVATDITERKRAEESIARFAAIVESSNDGILMLALDRTVLAWNAGAEALYGWSTAEAVGRPLSELISVPPELHAVQGQILERVAAGDVLAGYDTIRFGRDGRRVDVSLTVFPVRDASGAAVAIGGIHRDISERTQLEAERERLETQLRQSQKLEAVGQLAAGVAHDFNNKLAVILGSADMALAVTDPASEVRSDLEEIRTAAWRSADLTRQLLAFARMQPISPKQLDLNQTVESTLAMLHRLTGEGVGLEWIPCPEPCWVRIDPGQVDQVLVNLAVNARDAVSGSGTLRISTANVRLDGAFCASHADATPGPYVVIEVADDGCGMDDATKARIFEPFFTTKPVGQGTGLGLATVYGIAQQNRGFVDVESEPGKGTVIRVYLPQATEVAAAGATAVPAPIAIGAETVLVVEDEPALLKLTRKLIEQMGFTVLAAEGPGEAIRIAAEHAGDIDLLVSDVVMPGMNGGELLRRLHDTRPGLRCLFVSGYPASVLAETGVLAEDVDLLPKPYSQESLALKLREVLARG